MLEDSSIALNLLKNKDNDNENITISETMGVSSSPYQPLDRETTYME